MRLLRRRGLPLALLALLPGCLAAAADNATSVAESYKRMRDTGLQRLQTQNWTTFEVYRQRMETKYVFVAPPC